MKPTMSLLVNSSCKGEWLFCRKETLSLLQIASIQTKAEVWAQPVTCLYVLLRQHKNVLHPLQLAPCIPRVTGPVTSLSHATPHIYMPILHDPMLCKTCCPTLMGNFRGSANVYDTADHIWSAHVHCKSLVTGSFSGFYLYNW